MATVVEAQITGTVWKVQVAQGDEVTEGQVIAVLESMKMEVPVEAPQAGKVLLIHVNEGQTIEEGDALVTLGYED